MLKNYSIRNKKRSYKYASTIILLLIAPIMFNFYPFYNNENVMNNDKIPFLKISGDNINITTPEDTTYYGPMSSYFPGTYGFENDVVGSHPNGWYVREGVSGTVEVISSLGTGTTVRVEFDDSGEESDE